MKRRAALYFALVLTLIALVLAGVFLMGMLQKRSAPAAQVRISTLPLKTAALTPLPTAVPEPAATVVPTPEPTLVPMTAPTPVPTEKPTIVPTVAPMPVPTEKPTIVPTVAPTPVPTEKPTIVPTEAPTPVPTTAPTSAQTQAGADAQAVLELVNAQRTLAGLAPLTLSAELCGFAQIRAQEITVSFSHTRPDGTTPADLSPLIFGENIAMGTNMSAQMAMQLWMDSQGHRDNILMSAFKTLGVGCVQSGDLVYWVQLFGY